MRLGLHFMNFTMPNQPQSLPSLLGDTAEAAEEAGVAQFSVMDHWFQMDRIAPHTDPMLEAYTTLGYLAARTSKLRLGTVVTGVTYRHPGLLAKIVTTLDVLSSGRAFAGIGAAWYEREHLALGVAYPPIAERFERLEETLQILLQMWSGEQKPYEGAHYSLGETVNSPAAISTPHPPIMIGGSGEKKTLRMAAQYAQIVNIMTATPDEVAHKLEVLRAHCDRLGTDYDAIEKTIMFRGDPAGDDFLDEARAFAKLGVSMLVMPAPAPDPVGWVRSLGSVTPALADI